MFETRTKFLFIFLHLYNKNIENNHISAINIFKKHENKSKIHNIDSLHNWKHYSSCTIILYFHRK